MTKGRGGAGKRLVLLTPDCFKRLCMRSKTATSEMVRSYFLRMETRMYFAAKAAKSEHNVAVLASNQRPRASSASASDAFVLSTGQGYIYIFAVDGRFPDLYRVGSTMDFRRRARQLAC